MPLYLSDLDIEDTALSTTFVPTAEIDAESVQEAVAQLGRQVANINLIGTSNTSLKIPDLLDESDDNYFYFGWENINNTWLIQRQRRSTTQTKSISVGYANLALAWAERTNLDYI